MTHKLGRLPDTSAQSIMKREFGFTQARFRSARRIGLSCQREASKIPPDRSPAKSLMPPPIPPRAGEAPF